MFVGEILYRYTFKGQEVGGRIKIKEYNGDTVIKTSKEVEFSLDDINHLMIAGVQLVRAGAHTIELIQGVDGLLYNPYGDAPSIDVKTTLRQIGFAEWSFYDWETQSIEQEVVSLIPNLFKGRRLFVGSNHIQLAPVSVLTKDIENSPYVAVSVSRRVLKQDWVKETLLSFYYTGKKYGYREDILNELEDILSYKFNVKINKDVSEDTNKTKYTCVSCKHSVMSEYVIARCPRCLAPVTTKEGVINAW